jgi:O-ureido-D-serine cyclo-ligase
MTRIALVTAIAAAGVDDDLAPLLDACARAGLHVQVRAWDDATVGWSRFDAAILRSPWDYTARLDEFLAWCTRTSTQTRLLNPLPVVEWNTDKHYLAELAARGVPVVPTAFVEPDMEPLPALQAFLAAHADAVEFVVKPTVGAGSKDAQRYARSQEFAAANHLARLLDAERSAMLQPYLVSVDEHGETGLMYFDGQFSHAIRKGPLLRPGEGPTDHLFAAEAITPRVPSPDELALAEHVLRAARDALQLRESPLYARVDLIRDGEGEPCLLELELCEPSLFFAQAPGSAERFAALLARTLRGVPA